MVVSCSNARSVYSCVYHVPDMKWQMISVAAVYIFLKTTNVSMHLQ